MKLMIYKFFHKSIKQITGQIAVVFCFIPSEQKANSVPDFLPDPCFKSVSNYNCKVYDLSSVNFSIGLFYNSQKRNDLGKFKTSQSQRIVRKLAFFFN